MISIENKLQELGFIVKSIREGRVNRCGTIDKPKKKNGWFRVYEDSVSYGTWDDTIPNGYFWTKEITPLTPEEKQEYAKKRAEREIKQREVELLERIERLDSINKAYALTKQNKTHHAYLERKQMTFRQDYTFDFQQRLVIPVLNVQNHLVGYQYINDNGDKLFKTGSILKGGLYPFKPYHCTIADLDLIFMCEGVATADAIYQSMDEMFDSVNYGVIACFSAGNVKNIIADIHQYCGRKSIIGIADNDDAGIKAYDKTGVKYFVCGLQKGEDANDILVQFGKEKLAKLIVNFMEKLK